MKKELSTNTTALEVVEQLKALIIQSLDDHKAEDITIIDLKGKSDMADYMVIATGRSDRHVVSVADNLVLDLKEQGILVAVEGKTTGDWVLIDAFDIIVHVFRQEIRDLYNLEKMWKAELPA